MEDVTTARALGLPFGRLMGPGEMEIMTSDPWVDLLYPHLDREFFFEKPDTDIFSPLTSRFHRGWFHIKPWPHAPEPIIHPSYAETGSIAGGDIPIEVVQRIAGTLSVDSASHYEPVAHKRELAACALMCRAWTPVCQAKIFNRITLRCARDVRELLAFLMDPTSSVREYIYDLRVPHQNLAGPPWIHHLASLYPYLPHLPRFMEGYRNIDSPIVHTLNGPLPRGLGPLRSIHQALPRTPPVFSSYIQEVHLSNLHFRRFNDLGDLVAELRDLCYFACDNLTIAGPQPQPPRALGYMPEVVMRDCNFSWASMWLYPGRRRGVSEWEERVDVEDHKRIGELARIVGSGFEGLHTAFTTKSQRIDHGPHVEFNYGHAFKITYSISPTQFVILAVMAKDRKLPTDLASQGQDDAVAGALNSRILHVYKVQIVLSFGNPKKVENYKFFQDIDWRAFDKTASSFPHLETVKLDFITVTDLLNFVERSAHGTMLDELFARKKLAYSIKFKSQPFDWPMGVYTAKVGLPPPFGSQLDQEAVLFLKRQVDHARAYLTQMFQQEYTQADSEISEEPLPDSSDSRGGHPQIYNTSSYAEGAAGSAPPHDINEEMTCGNVYSAQQGKSRDYNMLHDEYEEDGPRNKGGMSGLNSVISEAFPHVPHRITVDWSDPVLQIVYIG